MRFWIRTTSRPQRLRIKSEAITKVKGAFDKKGIKIPFPHREIIQLDK